MHGRDGHRKQKVLDALSSPMGLCCPRRGLRAEAGSGWEESIWDSVLGLAGSLLCASVQINQRRETVQLYRSLPTVPG